MTNTRRPKRKAAQAALDVIKKARVAEEEEDDFEEEPITQALVVSSPKPAKPKSTKSFPPFEMLPIDVLPYIFLYLDSARDVYRLANCAKYLRASLTPEIVVRAAVFEGGKARESIQVVVGAVKNKAIHVPSTLRLLRLVNAKRCERGDQCFGYDVVEEEPQKLTKNGRLPFGLAICSTCVQYASASIVKYHGHLGGEDRVFSVDYTRLLSQPYYEAATGDLAGPLVLAQPAVKQIENRYPQLDQKDDRKEAVDRLLAKIDKATPTEDTVRAEGIVRAYETAESQFHAFQESKRKVIWDKRNQKANEKSVKKRKNVQVVLSKVLILLQDLEHKDFALRYDWDGSGCCHFKCKPVDEVLGPLLRAPSCATQKKIAAAVDSAREVVDLLYSNGFIPSNNGRSNYLPFLRPQEERHHRALYRYCLAERRSDTLLGCKWSGYSDMMDLLREGRPVDALLSALLSPRCLQSVFCRFVVKERDHRQRTKLETLARAIWARKVSRPNLIVDTEELFCQKFNECRREFRLLLALIRDYLADPLTIEFLQETGPPPHRAHLTRQNAVDKIYNCGPYQTFGYDWTASLQFLRARDFESLRAHHRNIFLNPRRYEIY